MNCNKCSVVFTRTADLKRHEKSIHSEDRDQLTCDICKKSFSRRDILLRHINSLHGAGKNKEIKKHKCVKCKHVFSRVSNLKKHVLRRHTETKCNVCEDRLPGSVSLLRHKKLMHGKNKCTECGQAFHSIKNLTTHNARAHQRRCSLCGAAFRKWAHVRKHMELMHGIIQCDSCGWEFKDHNELNIHISREHGVRPFKCTICGNLFLLRHEMLGHMQTEHNNKTQQDGVTLLDTAFDGHFKSYRVRDNNDKDLIVHQAATRDKLTDLLDGERRKRNGIKYFIATQVILHKKIADNVLEARPTFRSSPFEILQDENIVDITEAESQISQKLEAFIQLGSGWVLHRVLHVDLHTSAYNPLRGSTFIETPPWIQSKKAVINVQNLSDDKCFLWSILSLLHPQKKNASRCSKYSKFVKEINMENMDFPVKINQMDKFEKQNPKFSINIYAEAAEHETIYPLRVSCEERPIAIDLLLLSDDTKQHYIAIKDFGKLVSKQYNKHNGKLYFCRYCVHGFSSEKCLQEHKRDCRKHKPNRVIMPDKESFISFNNQKHKLKTPFVIYGDFESSIIHTSNYCGLATEILHEHHANSFSLQVVSSSSKYTFEPITYIGNDAVDMFFRTLRELSSKINDIIKKELPMIGAPSDSLKARVCHICEKEFSAKDSIVRDHDHLDGDFRGFAHRDCNLNFWYREPIPVLFHNGSNYDKHLIMQGIEQHAEQITVIPENVEKYKMIKFSWLPDETGNTARAIKVIDSCRFLPAKLEDLANNCEDFKLVEEWLNAFGRSADWVKQALALMKRKGLYPYQWVGDLQKMHEQLPPKEAFYSSLKDEGITDEDYIHVQKVWEHFECTEFKDYHRLYLELDVQLLANVFETFRTLCLREDGLDPVYYVSLAGYSWSAMLKMTNVQLEALHDINMYLFFEEAERGGVSQISQRHGIANNPHIEGYDPTKPTKWLVYLDANNLYGCAMISKLPISNFRWMSRDELDNIDLEKYNGSEGCTLEVDLEYPFHLHDSHNDYPLLPEPITPEDGMLSPYSMRLKNEFGLGKQHQKLIPHLGTRIRYKLHHTTLKLCLQLGIRLIKIHRGIAYTQEAWLKPFIDYNTEMRKHAKTQFEKDFFKLKNNSIYGKSMENVRLYESVKIVTDKHLVGKYTADAGYRHHVIFGKNAVAIARKSNVIKLNKPVYAGAAILDISKNVMYDFYYNVLKAKYNDKIGLCMTDTDSLLVTIETKDWWDDLREMIDHFDISEFPTNHVLFDKDAEILHRKQIENKKKPGLFKDEVNGRYIRSVIGLRPKMYSILLEDKSEKNRGKGIPKHIVKKNTKHKDYEKCLHDEERKLYEAEFIRSKQHNIITIRQQRCGLSPYDDKRYILEDGVSTMAYGHYRTAINKALDFAFRKGAKSNTV